MDGSIISYDSFTGLGKVQDGSGVHVFRKGDCSPGLQLTLNQKTIPPDPQMSVSYDVTAMNTAINVVPR